MSEKFKIEKIAIIGAGPGGLVTLNELLHTDKNGESTIVNPSSNFSYPKSPAFKDITVFEQNDKIGGVWNYSEKTDPNFPSNVENYSKPEFLRPHLLNDDNTEFNENLENSNINNPIVINENSDLVNKYNNAWNKSAVYDHLFTNIPNYLMRFSTSFNDDKIKVDKNSKVYEPFTTHQNILNYLNDYVEKYNLKEYIRFNTSVEKVYKKNNKWYVSVCNYDKISKTFKYYTETFDAVVISIGRFNVPFYPKIEGLKKFNNSHPNVVIHSKSFRKTDNLKGKKVLLVGSSISALDIAQYLIPICDLHISSNSKTISKSDDLGNDNNSNTKTKSWAEKVFSNNDLNWTKHGRISKFDDNTLEFEDGSKESNFDQIIFCTGYHLYYPFLEIPENKGKNYISISSGFDNNPNYAMTKVDNLYLYTFTIADPTLCHTGIAHNPLFFLTSEANAISIAGVWSNNKKLPSLKEQRQFIEDRFKGKKSRFQVYDETTIRDFINKCYEFAPTNRFNFLPYVNNGEIKKSKDVLSDLFYKFANKELDEFDPSTQYCGV